MLQKFWHTLQKIVEPRWYNKITQISLIFNKVDVIMGSGGVPNRTVEISYERSLKTIGKPNSRVDKYNQNGKKVQSRWYDKKGKAVRNRDYTHSNPNVIVPHDHVWIEGVRSSEHLVPDYDNFN